MRSQLSKRILALLLTLAMILTLLPTVFADAPTFTDVEEGKYYYEAVQWAVEKGITTGKTDTTFGPNDPCTRGQVVTFLWRTFGQPEPTTTEHPFLDVAEGKYYYKAMLWAVEKKITAGTSATTFGPDRPCTRGQIVTFLWRAADKPEAASEDHPFTDVEKEKYYYDAMLWAVENKITSGVSATSFAPENPCTRGQVVTFLYRAFKDFQPEDPNKPDKDELEDAIDDAEELEETAYTPASFAAFQAALSAAQAVLNDPNATQEEIDEALAALEEAIAALQPASTDFVLAIPKDGDEIVIYNAGNGMAVTAEMSGYYVQGTAVTPTEDHKIIEPAENIVWTVTMNEDGTMTLRNGEKVLAAGQTPKDGGGYYNNLYLEEGTNSIKWTPSVCNPDNYSYTLTAAGLQSQYGGIYLEWYGNKSAFSAYDTSADRATEQNFGFQAYVKGAEYVEPAKEPDYVLFGWINGANYACEEDWENAGEYKFVDGKLTATFTEDSYVAVKKADNSAWYMTDGWLGTEVTSALLFNTETLGENGNKLFVPGGVEVEFTLEQTGNDTLTLSYAPKTAPEGEYVLAEPENGDEVVIYNAGHGLAIRNETDNNWYLLGSEVTVDEEAHKITNPAADIVWTVATDGNGMYRFTNGDNAITCYVSGTYFELTNNAHYEGGVTDWALKEAEGAPYAYFIKNWSLTGQYGDVWLEFYTKNNQTKLSAYSTSDDKLTLADFGFQFYVKGAEYVDPETPPVGEEKVFVKVTEAQEDWSGTYVIARAKNETTAYVFDGANDKNENFVEAALSGDQITASLDNAIVIEKSGDGYTFQAKGGYLNGKGADANGLVFETAPAVGTIAFENDLPVITSASGNIFRFNNKTYTDASYLWFRFFKASSSVTTDANTFIELYKLDEGVEPPPPAPDYVLFGWINGANYACEEDWENAGEYKFVDGKLTATFEQNSYVAVKLSDNSAWYMTDGWLGEEVTSATLYNTTKEGLNADKLFVPGGVEVEFTLVDNGDDTLTLSYEKVIPPEQDEYALTGELHTGDEVVIYSPAAEKAVDSTLKATYYLTPTEVEKQGDVIVNPADTAVWTVTVNGNGTYTFDQFETGLTLVAYASGSYVDLGNTTGEGRDPEWVIETKDADANTFTIKSSTIKKGEMPVYLEWYAAKTEFSAYGSNDPSGDVFAFQFYSKVGGPGPGQDLQGKIVILHTNDTHGAIMGFANAAALKRDYEARGAKVYLVDAGDFSQGTTYVSSAKGATAIDVMNAAGYDFATLGNHEFDFGYAKLKENLENANFRVLCADVILKESGEPAFYSYAVEDVDGFKIGFFGMETPETFTKVNPGLITEITFPQGEEMYALAQGVVDALRNNEGVDLVIGLVHLGVDDESEPNRSIDLYNNVDGIDFLIDGHSHTVMTEGPNGEPIQSTGTKADKTKFMNVGCIIIDPTAERKDGRITNELIPITEETPREPATEAVAQEIMDRVDAEYGQKFATSEVELNGNAAPGNRTEETNLGDLITDALRWSVLKDMDAETLGVPEENVIAITNGGGIRAPIHIGDVTKNDVNTVLPFGNTVAVVYVTGAELLEALEASTFCTPTKIGGFPQVSGIKYNIDVTKDFDQGEQYPDSTYYAPASIQRVTIDNINGQAFDPAAKYAVITNNFCAAGGDTYYAFKAATAQFDTGIPMDEALIAYITEELEGVIGQTYAEPQGRITQGALTPPPAPDYVLCGWINGAACSDEDAWETPSPYVFEDGQLTATFTEDSYVWVKLSDNSTGWKTDGYTENVTSAIFYNYNVFEGKDFNKMKVPGGVELEFTLVDNGDDTLTLSYAVAAPAQDLLGKIVILHTNDTHGAIMGFANAAALKRDYEARGAKVFLVDAGDFSQGTTYVSSAKGATAIEVMNEAGYDFATLGNHEFDFGYAQLKENLESANFRVLCADVILKETGEPAFYSYAVEDVDGFKIGFFGMETPETFTKVNPGLITEITFPQGEEMYALAQGVVDALRNNEGVDMVIGIVHLGVDGESIPNRSIDLYNNVDGIDFLIDGHSHTVMTEGPDGEPIQSTGTKASKTMFQNVGCIIIDPTAERKDGRITNELIPITEETPREPATEAVAQEIMDRVDAEYGQKFATSEVELNGNAAPGNRTEETNLGDLITDALRWSVLKDMDAETLGVPEENVIAITNGGGIRAPIHIGDVTKNDVNTVLPFGNTVAVVYVTGAELLEALEASTFCTPTKIGGFPQVSGIKYNIDVTKDFDQGDLYPGSTYHAPASIRRVTIDEINGQAFDPAAKYAVVTNNFCAAGGDTYYAFKAATAQFDTGIPMDEALISYITEELEGVIGQTYAEPQGRITQGALTPPPAPDYVLFGWINGANYACEEDWENAGEYKFVDGKLTATFEQNSYVAVKLSDNSAWYMTDGWLGEEVTSATLYNTTKDGLTPDKLFVPGGVEFEFTLTVNGDDTLTLSYAVAAPVQDLLGKTVILHTNDTHGALMGFAQVAKVKAEYEARGAEVILVDAGDFSQGTTYVSTNKGEAAVTVMNAAGYDVATLGNHEFDFGYAQLMTNLGTADFDALCADVFVKASGESILPATVIKEVGGVKIGFFGMETPETQTKVNPGLITEIEFGTNENGKFMTSAVEAIDALKAAGADLIIGLVHLGVDAESEPYRSVDLYAKLEGVDFLIDGHSHTVMTEGPSGEPIQSTGTKASKTAFMNVGAIVIDNETKKIEKNYLIPLGEEAPADETVAAVAQGIMDAVDAEYGAKFATSEVELNGNAAPGNRTEETNLGDLITDALRWSVLKDMDAETLGVPEENVIAITNGGGIRAPIHIGDVTKNDVNTVLPFGNTVAVVYVTGAELLEALEASTFCTPTKIGGFPQVSGIKYNIDTTKAFNAGDLYPGSTYHAPATIRRVTIDEINGQAFDPAAKYAVVTNNFCAAGGDTYYAFKAATAQFDTGIPMDEALIAYITEELSGVITEPYDAPQGRITMEERESVNAHKFEIVQTSNNSARFGHLDMNVSVADFLEIFALGDIVTVTVGDYSFDAPVVTNYDDVLTFEHLLRCANGKQVVTLAINYSQIGVAAGLLEPVDGGYAFVEGIEWPLYATVELKEAGGYAEELAVRAMTRTNDRADYASDEEFANFRAVSTTGMGENVLYRSSSPVSDEIGRNVYADALAEAAGIKTFINLADNADDVLAGTGHFTGYAGSYYATQSVKYLGLPVAFTSAEFKAGLAEGYRYIITNEAPYMIHCLEGKDRTGLSIAVLEALMGASLEEIQADYLKTYENYFDMVEGVHVPLTDAQKEVVTNIITVNLGIIFDADLETANLADEATAYLLEIGLAEDEITTLKADLAGRVAPDYVLFGWINGANYACEEDFENPGEYKFVDGNLTATFEQNSYVAVKLSDNSAWYMTDGWLGEETTSATLYNTTKEGLTPDKLFVPGGVEVEFTLTVNGDDTLTLSYAPTVAEPEYVYYHGMSVADGDEVVIVNREYSMAVSNADLSETATNYRAGVAVTPVDGIIEDPAEETIWTVAAVEGGFEFTDAAGKKLSIPTGKNQLVLDGDDTVWTIENSAKTDGAVYVASATSKGGSGDPRAIEWYASYNEFSTFYLSATSDETLFALDLYVKTDKSTIHEHNWVAGTVDAADCTHQEVTHYTCSICSEEKTEVTGEALGHAWGAYVETTAPGCTTAGVETANCTRCEATDTREIPALGHTDENSDNVCDTCGANLGGEPPVTESYYVKVSDASELQAGDVIIFVCESKLKACSAMADKAFLNATDITIEDGKIVSDDVIQITLGGEAGAWTFTTSEGLLGSTAAKKLNYTGSGTTTWTIEIDGDGNATATVGSFGRILYNVNSPRFLNYTSATTASMLLPQIYKLVEG